jgi:hypothetical protein
VAHHAPAGDEGPGQFLPESRLLRAVLALVASAVAGMVALLLWVTGGLESADAAADTAPGTPVTNDMFTLTVHDAAITTDPELGGSSLVVRADLRSHDTRPFTGGDLGRIIEPKLDPHLLEPGPLSIAFERHPDGVVSGVQPDMTEEVTLSWPLSKVDPEAEKDPDAPVFDPDQLFAEPEDLSAEIAREESVTLRVFDAEYASGFTDQSESWGPGGTTLAAITLPLDKGE